jgi:hypothetical protein
VSLPVPSAIIRKPMKAMKRRESRNLQEADVAILLIWANLSFFLIFVL